MNPGSSPVPDLRGIHAPPPPDLWPPAPGWWVAAVLLGTALVILGLRGYRRYRLRRQRQEVLATLDGLASAYSAADAQGFVTEVSSLLRRVALARFPRKRVASLLGREWLRFLDETGGEGAFTAGAGQVLATGPYAVQVKVDAEALTALARDWITKNTGVSHES
jgi:hypothetical protein